MVRRHVFRAAAILGVFSCLACGAGPAQEPRGETEERAGVGPGQERVGVGRESPAGRSQGGDGREGFFLDIAADAGLDVLHFNGMSGEYFYSEMMGSGVAFLDYDNDGDLDIYVVQGHMLGSKETEQATFPPPAGEVQRDRLFRNEQAAPGERPRFLEVTGASGIQAEGYGMGVVAADFDNDGWTDLYLTNAGPNQLWRNQGDGTFREVAAEAGATEPRWSVPAVAWDFDADGWLDLFVGNYLDYTVNADKKCNDEIGGRNYCGPLSYGPEGDTLLRNLGNGHFEDHSKTSGVGEAVGGALGTVAADLDGDGRLDLYVANDGVPNQAWINLGDGRFEDRALLAGLAVNGQGHPEASMGVAVADYDRDGDDDLFLTHLARETHTLYANDGQGFFRDRSVASGLAQRSLEATGFGTGFLDFDNDGTLDLLVVNGAVKVIKSQALAGDLLPLAQANQLFRGLGGGRFEEVTAQAGAAFSLAEVSRGAAFGDVDNDGDTDVLVSNNSGPLRLLLNRVGQNSPWLGVRLIENGRDAFGARAGLRRSDWRGPALRVGGAASYASSSDPRLLFGLGDVPAAAGELEVEVRWANGEWEVWSGLALGAYHTLEKGRGQRRPEDPS